MIPKIIHYCWFGGGRKPQMVKDCIASWRKYLPDYKIIEWNEENTEFNIEFINEAYSRRKWAFVVDYVRLSVLLNEGGIYLDTDMYVIKNMDSLLKYECFLGAEVDEYLNGAIIGAIKKHPFIEFCMQKYLQLDMKTDNELKNITLPKIITLSFREKYSFLGTFKDSFEIDDIKIFSKNYFYPFPYRNHYKKFNISIIDDYCNSDTYGVHLWAGSWKEYDEFQLMVKRKYFLAFKIILKRIFTHKNMSRKYLKKIKMSFKESLK